MKKIIKNTKFKLESAVIALGTLFITDPVFAATDPQAKLVQEWIITSLIYQKEYMWHPKKNYYYY